MAARAVISSPASMLLPLTRFLRSKQAAMKFFAHKFDFVIDAIDSLRSKESLILNCAGRGG